MAKNKINAARNLQKVLRGREMSEPGKCIFYGDKVWEGFSEPETHEQNAESVLGRTKENSRARCRTTGRFGRKANALKAPLCQLGFCFKEHGGVCVWGGGSI